MMAAACRPPCQATFAPFVGLRGGGHRELGGHPPLVEPHLGDERLPPPPPRPKKHIVQRKKRSPRGMVVDTNGGWVGLGGEGYESGGRLLDTANSASLWVATDSPAGKAMRYIEANSAGRKEEGKEEGKVQPPSLLDPRGVKIPVWCGGPGGVTKTMGQWVGGCLLRDTSFRAGRQLFFHFGNHLRVVKGLCVNFGQTTEVDPRAPFCVWHFFL